MKPLSPNTMIQNRYLVVHLIGKGGMGEVYLAVDQRLGNAVALKRTFYADNEILGAAFEREAKILARLRHPVLPKVSDHFVENGDQYLIMEHISGDDLSNRLEAAKKPFPVSWVMFWADQLLDALSYLHSHEPPIIHRDIKPQNLKLTDENHIVLLDFGLSKDSSNVTIPSQPGKSGSVVGYTPHFALMEQSRGTGTDGRSDIYSLSATLYQLVTNTVPSDVLSRADAMLSGKSDSIISISDANPEISPAISNVILKGLEVSQDKRFATASEMQKALRTAYSQLQNSMSVETQVFNASDFHSTVAPEADPTAPVAPSEMATPTPTNDSGVISTFDDTVQMDQSVIPNPSQQNDIKTEVLSGINVDAYAVKAVGSQLPPHELPVAGEPCLLESDANGEILTKISSMPLAADAIRERSANPLPPTHPVASSPTVQKASGSKTGLILGGLAALFIFAITAIGGGWYYFTNYYKAAEVRSMPSPTPTATVMPTQIPTPNTDTNSASVSNSNLNSNLSVSSNVNPVSQPTVPLNVTSKPDPVPKARDTTPKPPKAPVTPKASPKVKPQNDRTVILQ